MQLKVWHLILVGMLGYSSAQAQNFAKYQLLAQGGAYSFTVDNPQSGSTGSDISGFGAYNLNVAMGFKEQFSGFFGFSVLASKGIGGDLATGFDVGVKYYPWTSYGRRHFQTPNMLAMVKHHMRPYFGVAARQRDFFTTLASKYVGAGILGGVDYDFHQQWFLNAEARIDYLLGQSQATAIQMNVLGGIGLHF